jgi:endoglucanase
MRRLLLAALVAALAAPAAASAANPLAGQRWFVDTDSPAWQQVRAWQDSRPADARLIMKIASNPQAVWFAGESVFPTPTRRAERLFRRTDAQGTIPIIAVRALQHFGCGRGYDGRGPYYPGGAGQTGPYKRWIDAFVEALAGHRAVVILEPDGLGEMHCVTRSSQRVRYALLRYATRRLGAVPGVTTYLDVGSSSWMKRAPALRALKAAGVRHVRGFATNSTHFNWTRDEIRYGRWLSARLGGKHFVVNTAENGRGPLKKGSEDRRSRRDTWCNPPGRGLGTRPTTRTAHRLVDAYLWISRPGLSSNGKVVGQHRVRGCGRGPLNNGWWAERALELARNAIF